MLELLGAQSRAEFVYLYVTSSSRHICDVKVLQYSTMCMIRTAKMALVVNLAVKCTCSLLRARVHPSLCTNLNRTVTKFMH